MTQTGKPRHVTTRTGTFQAGPSHVHEYTPGGGSISNPPGGKKAITNIYWDPDTNEIVVEHD